MHVSFRTSINKVQKGLGGQGKEKVRAGRPGVEAAHPSLTVLRIHSSSGG